MLVNTKIEMVAIMFIPVPVGRGPYTFIRQTGCGACKMDRVEGSAGFVRKRCVLRPKLLWPTIRKWGVAHTVVVFFSRSRDPEVTFRGHVMFQVLIKRRFSRRRRDFSIESDCLGLPEAESVEIRHFPRWRTQTGSGFPGAFFASES